MERIDAEASGEAERSAMIAAEQQLMWRNKAVSDTYEPGSTFKIITLAMALEEGAVDLDSQFYCGGSVTVPGRNTPASAGRPAGTARRTSPPPCSTAATPLRQYRPPRRRGALLRLRGGLRLFERTGDTSAQLTGKTGIDLGGRAAASGGARTSSATRRTSASSPAASFGQTFNITPLQLITAVSACVNGGRLMRPYLVSEIRSPPGESETHEPETVRRVISEETSAKVCSILEQVVGDPNEGTGPQRRRRGIPHRREDRHLH